MSLTQQLLPGVPNVESLLFNASLADMGLTDLERDIAIQLNTQGYAVFDFPDDELDARIERIRADLTPKFDFAQWRRSGWKNSHGLRLANAWHTNADVRAIAVNEGVIDLLSKLYGRKAFPFQTLNFPVGTQQHVHADTVHFSSVPERFMCGVWLALEDIGPDAGPLMYYPGSHKWPVLHNDMLGRYVGAQRFEDVQGPFEPVWRALAEQSGIQPEYFHAKKGQAVIWSANLLHGGSAQTNPEKTRWSQVTHYFFEDCVYYQPSHSDPLVSNIEAYDIVDISTQQLVPNMYLGRPYESLVKASSAPASPAMTAPVVKANVPDTGQAPPLPADFDANLYLLMHPDVKRAGVPAEQHYMLHGWKENRRYK
ncbi:phytanoyl-CoA dioxygenase family protein [Asticcacaulis sp.]|uniref:phytanoyl-CoA dioxygenase family protein n=1 Tax=Asticcacaulis sp. TaxID=1872648 RepID=UPI002C267673|nr:phytanoyl-CoA dioxygenase family protein [Asticcacaulis sp.]HTM80550.1 phytanoyl-CoA dioxygenase family protein [Asticcacaulis sp.]